MDVVGLGLAKADAARKYALRYQSSYSGGAPDVQLPTTRTINVQGAPGSTTPFSVLGFRNNDPSAPDSATRLYIVPRKNQHVTSGVGGALKLFADDYFADDGTAANYRDFGLYFHANQVGPSYAGGDAGTNGAGVFWLNTKVNGSYASQNPDIGFSFQDGQSVAGRFALVFGTGGLAGQLWPVLVIGASKPDIATKTTVIGLEMQRDLGFNGAGRGIRWYDDAGTPGVTNLMQFNGADWQVKLNGAQQLKVTKVGAIVHGSTQLAAASTDGFLYMRSIAGTPTGTPATNTGTVPIVIDPTGSKLWAYVGGAWKSVTLA